MVSSWIPQDRFSFLTIPLNRSSDAKTGQYQLVNPDPLVHSPVFFPTDWQLWTAATLTDQTLRTNMIGLVKKYASSRLNNRPFPDRYNSTNGQMNTFSGRTAVGGHFALVRFLDCPPYLKYSGLILPI